MKKIWKNYKQTIILLLALVVGTIAGLIFGEKTEVVKPLGDLFMNLLFVIIVPLIFLTITTSIAKIAQPKRLGKTLKWIVVTFAATTLIACAVGLAATYSIKLVNPEDTAAITEKFSTDEEAEEVKAEHEADDKTVLARTVEAISVSDFKDLISKNSILALVVISILVGLSANKVGEDGKAFVDFLESANKVVLKLVDIIFLYAPIGLGCYFAALIGTFGSEIALGFGKTFVIYTVLSILFFAIVYSLYAFIAGGKKGVIAFWKNVLPATATSISTCSSAASIPANIKSVKGIGVSDDIAETIVPLGTSFHKDGSAIGSVFKIMFLVYLLGTEASVFQVIGVAIIANLLVTAVPVGGGTISEMMIITAMGFPVQALPILTIIATIIDPPATMLNVVGDTASAMLTARAVDGKDWMEEPKKETKKTKKN